MAEVQGSIFPEIQIIRTPRVVKVVCECLGQIGSFLGTQTLASHGDHLPSWLPEVDPRPSANEVIN